MRDFYVTEPLVDDTFFLTNAGKNSLCVYTECDDVKKDYKSGQHISDDYGGQFGIRRRTGNQRKRC